MNIDDFNRFFDKAGCSYPGPQRKAEKLWPKIKPHLTAAEAHEVSVAWSHVVVCAEGRRHLDGVRKQILARIKKERAS